jgi:hypothetical protein
MFRWRKPESPELKGVEIRVVHLNGSCFPVKRKKMRKDDIPKGTIVKLMVESINTWYSIAATNPQR